MIKQAIKNRLVKKRAEQYEKELLSKKDTYANWYQLRRRELVKELENADHSEGAKLTSLTVRYSHLRRKILSGEKLPDIIIACDDDGHLTDHAEMMIKDFFAAHRDIDLVYADEDRLDENNVLTDPWFKADWSPDTFLSTFYFGSIFAIRTSALSLINPGWRTASDMESKSALKNDEREEALGVRGELEDSVRSWIYGNLCLKLAQADGGFSVRTSDEPPVGHIREVLFHATDKKAPWDSRLIKESLTGRYSMESAASRLVSIIIPTKDHPEVLLRCLGTIEKYSQTAPYEVIIVDNGSAMENRERYKKIVSDFNENIRVVYLYRHMDFNFSRMCNLGAKYANGELLLFLNDDIEIRKPGWLSYLSEKAKLPYVGAVGMKLLYPNSDIIQHAGVVNVRVGPIHKLQYCDNRETHYFGYNKGVRNCIAVTGACLMVRAELFERVGGFDEENFAVSFNDIDLCYRIYERGYYNVVRNNMYLYHHESLSRGDDRKDKVKSERLSREQIALLTSHKALYGVDPYYHPYLTQNPAISEFEIGMEDMLLKDPVFVKPKKLDAPYPENWTDPVLRLGVEYANSLSDYFHGPFAGKEDRGYYIKGYAFVINGDNAVYDRRLLLKSRESGAVYEVPVENVYRADIAHNLTDQIHEYLTGFSALIPVGSLPAGEYEAGMIAVDKTSRSRIVNWSDVILTIQPE
ncbi:MAG: glycosyltransferase [Lachnospiraceae bacterium]|nr:glycosyltransferase [Lachnospiraceae bacterium]